MGIKSDAEQRKEKKRNKAVVRNELDRFEDLNWDNSMNSGAELQDPTLWVTVDSFAKEESTLQADIEMLKKVQQDIQNFEERKEGGEI